jgi:hypothetical protein
MATATKKKKLSNAERVFRLLNRRGPDGDTYWVAGYRLLSPSVGGSEGLRRLRELRAEGYEIRKKRKPGSAVYHYKMIMPHE